MEKIMKHQLILACRALLQGLLLLLCFADLQAQPRFTDATEAAGINHQFVVYEGMFGGGACVFDFNNDGYEDLYLTSGMNDDQLLLNQKDGTFKNIFEGSGLELTKQYVTQGVAGADVNRDGWVDLFITTINKKDNSTNIPRAENLLFLNNGNPTGAGNTFRDATKEYGLEKLYSFSTGGSFGDFNADGYPDLYVGNYFLEYDGPLTEINDATIVNASKTAEGYLLLNKAGKKYKNVYEDYGLNHRGFGFGGLFTDYDNDGDQDLYIINDFGYKAKPNYLLRNNYPKKSFTYVEEEAGMDLRINAMAAAVGDYDNNGFLDYFITNIKFNRFMVTQGAGKPYQDLSKELGMSMFTISWGANWADFDQDGDLDLFVANGDLNPNCVPMGNFLFENMGGKFQDNARIAGVNDYGMGRGSVVFDYDNDGDMDLLVINQKPIKDYPMPSMTKLFRNDSTHGNWLKVALAGVEAEKHGIGSRVRIVVGNTQMIREIDGGGSSHLSQNSTIAHFGLGRATVVDSVIVTWSGGNRQVLLNQAANQLLTISEVPTAKKENRLVWYTSLSVAALLLLFLLFKKRTAAKRTLNS
jgi:enediyne biosynthesis protein E4